MAGLPISGVCEFVRIFPFQAISPDPSCTFSCVKTRPARPDPPLQLIRNPQVSGSSPLAGSNFLRRTVKSDFAGGSTCPPPPRKSCRSEKMSVYKKGPDLEGNLEILGSGRTSHREP